MIYKLKAIDDKLIEKIYKKSIKKLNIFFNLNWQDATPSVYLVENRKTIDSMMSKKTPAWVIGYIDQNSICILNYKKLEKESSHCYKNYYSTEKKYYLSIIPHELAHVFSRAINPNIFRPTWLWEGTAIYASDQLSQYKRPKKLKNFLYFYKIHKDETGSVYTESGFAVEFLVKKYGKEKLLELIKAVKKDMSESNFAKLFKKIYNIPLDYKSFNKQ